MLRAKLFFSDTLVLSLVEDILIKKDAPNVYSRGVYIYPMG